jgi:hypothetical protein
MQLRPPIPLRRQFLRNHWIVSANRKMHHYYTEKNSPSDGQMLILEFLTSASERVTVVAGSEQKDLPA